MSDGRLSDAEQRAWGGFLRTHTSLFRELDSRLNRTAGLGLSDYDVLVRLARAPDGVPMRRLSELVFMTTGGLTRLVDRLERTGLVRRQRAEHDGRSVIARLTPEGRKTFRAVNRAHLADVRELFLAHLTAEQVQAFGDAWDALGPPSVPPPRGPARS